MILTAKDYIRIELCNRSFYLYCQTLAPDYYTDERGHLKELCNNLQALFEGKLLKPNGKPYKKLMIQLPPQHGKSRTLVLFVTWVMGKNPNKKVITGSYNDSTATDFSRYTRDTIGVKVSMLQELQYCHIFPRTKIKQGNSSYKEWALEGQHFSYLGAGIGGSVTSKGADILIVDDLVKGAKEALSDSYHENVWLWYSSTFLSRVSAKGGEPLEIFCMTPWSESDASARILASKDAENWYIFKRPACLNEETGEMLSKETLSFDRYQHLQQTLAPIIFDANYRMIYGTLAGRLFSKSELNRFTKKEFESLITYKKLGYIDVADEGTDCLSFPIASIIRDGRVYITDVVFDDINTDYTLPASAELIKRVNPEYVRVESNNMGGIFGKELRKLTKPEKILLINNSTSKHTRIILEYPFIRDHFYFLHESEYAVGSPYDKFIKQLLLYNKSNDNKEHDDAADSLSGLAVMVQSFCPDVFK